MISKLEIAKTQRVQIGERESIQNPSYIEEERWDNPGLSPPAKIIEDGVISLLFVIKEFPNCTVEFFNPASGPSSAKMVQRFMNVARQEGVENQTAIHTRMSLGDFNLAILCGATNVHLFANSLKKIGGRLINIQEWLDRLDAISTLAYQAGLAGLRASLEQATETDTEDLVEFVNGVIAIRNKPGRILTGLGVPDTNGRANCEHYQQLFSIIGDRVAQSGITVFGHFHDDKKTARQNTQVLLESGERFGFPVVIEAADDDYPGERVGTGPLLSELLDLGLSDLLPSTLPTMLEGSSWKHNNGIPYDVVYDRAMRTDVAGVHTRHQGNYGNGNGNRFPAPGIYSIMGGGNIGFWQEQGLRYIEASPEEVLKAAALVGRELAAQFGNLPHGDALALAYLAYQNPEVVLNEAAKFGEPLTWLEKDVPDLRDVYDKMREIRIHELHN